MRGPAVFREANKSDPLGQLTTIAWTNAKGGVNRLVLESDTGKIYAMNDELRAAIEEYGKDLL
jgi:hypothetical protein